MREEDVVIGSLVVVRDYEDMAREYGTDDSGGVDVGPVFTTHMIPVCGSVAKVISCGYGRIGLEFLDNENASKWMYSPEMVRPFDECPDDDDIEPASQDELMEIISGA